MGAAAAEEVGQILNGGFEEPGRKDLPASWHVWHGGGYGIDNLAYNKTADERSWAAMMRLFGEVLK